MYIYLFVMFVVCVYTHDAMNRYTGTACTIYIHIYI